MIGQIKNRAIIDKWVSNACPQFICIVGNIGSGKRTLAYYIAKQLGLSLSLCNIGVDDVREVIRSASICPSVYCFADADNMSTNAKNALLKIVEEPPENTYFIMTVQDESSLLDTIISRAQIIRVEVYTKAELQEYAQQKYSGNSMELILEVATSPFEVDTIYSYGQDFLDFVDLVIYNIWDVDFANAFKSGTRLALKSEDTKYDLSVFFATTCKRCLHVGLDTGNNLYLEMCAVTNEFITKSKKIGINKQMLFDRWVLAVRSCI